MPRCGHKLAIDLVRFAELAMGGELDERLRGGAGERTGPLVLQKLAPRPERSRAGAVPLVR